MTVHINGSKGKELYYNGVKIKEAYYGSTKVYSSGPLYYCYKYDGLWTAYEYLTKKPTSDGTYTLYARDGQMTQATKSSDLTTSYSNALTNVTDSSFVSYNAVWNYYPSGDLYT